MANYHISFWGAGWGVGGAGRICMLGLPGKWRCLLGGAGQGFGRVFHVCGSETLNPKP